MLILVETPAGYTLWKVNNEGALQEPDLCKKYPTPDDARKILSLQSFAPFENSKEALAASSAIAHSELNDELKTFIEENVVSSGIKEKLFVTDSALAHLIQEKLGVNCTAPSGQDVPEIFRLIKNNQEELLPSVDPESFRNIELSVSHGLATQTLKFSPSKVDSMIVHSVNLLEDLDKEINNYGMRVREWYGWHFPELKNITSDNFIYSQIVLNMGFKENAIEISDELRVNLSQYLNVMQIDELCKIAARSTGIELSPEDLSCIQDLCKQVIKLIEFRNQISEYINQRMRAIAPNLSEIVGESIGARLIAHAGSLRQLAKVAGSTIQVFGAEKALFRALKEQKKTPKYGLIYHAQIVSHADQKFRGRISRSLAAKTALMARIDEFSTEDTQQYGSSDREILDNRLRQMEGQKVTFGESRAAIKEVTNPPPIAEPTEQAVQYKVEDDVQTEQPPEEEKTHRKKHRHHHHVNEEAPAQEQ